MLNLAVRCRLAVIVFIAVSLALPTLEPQRARAESPVLTRQQWVTGLQLPVSIRNANDASGRLFIVEQTGRVRVVVGQQLLPTPLIDIADRITAPTPTAYERGLFDIAFPPRFAEKRYFYLSYTDTVGASVISRFRLLSDNIADPASEQVVLRFARTASNHNGGQIKFGPDGMLWIATGDSGGGNDPANSAQNPRDLRGKMLRIDTETGSPITYTVPATNPFVGNPTFLPEIWAVGLRNPWRFSFDPLNGNLFIADVGQGAREEINLVPSASGDFNFGWRIWEGDRCAQSAAECAQGGFTAPIATYVTGQNGNCSVTGGYVYRGALFPNLVGRYVYGDYCSGRIWSLTANGSSWQNELLLSTTDQISSFGVDEQGTIYYAAHGAGVIYQLRGSQPAGQVVTNDLSRFAPVGLTRRSLAQ